MNVHIVQYNEVRSVARITQSIIQKFHCVQILRFCGVKLHFSRVKVLGKRAGGGVQHPDSLVGKTV